MPNKYEHDSERWLRNNAEIYTRMGSPQIAQKMVLCADEVTRLRAELAALKEAVSPAAKWWRTVPANGLDEVVVVIETDNLNVLDALAALVGEEWK